MQSFKTCTCSKKLCLGVAILDHFLSLFEPLKYSYQEPSKMLAYVISMQWRRQQTNDLMNLVTDMGFFLENDVMTQENYPSSGLLTTFSKEVHKFFKISLVSSKYTLFIVM